MIEEITLARDRRPLIFRQIVESGPNSAEILRGLEWPDMDDDPVFWREGSLADHMRLPESLDEAQSAKGNK
ncbi:hypothetical protein [Roseovarius sp. A46]|uniref:hypothetical protein n=1 Tax=Roseovarius sp. A46 TaxID=2109331 RepID=UPI0010115006|nr:hypothetical protein [Roseovarius sp. A46]